MKFSENTLNVLKNFASINSGLSLKAGTVQKTMTPEKTVLAEVVLEDALPEGFNIYDLNQFLGNVSILNAPELDFTPEYVTMTDGKYKTVYYSCSPTVIVAPPDKELVMKDIDVEFDITAADMQKILKLAALNNFPHISIKGTLGGGIYVRAHDKANDTSNRVDFDIDKASPANFTASFKTENLKMIPDDYHVEIKLGGFAKFTNTKGTLKYFIALESK
jgi:hypothetical protein